MTTTQKVERVGRQLAAEYIAALEAGRCPPRLRAIIAARREDLIRAVADRRAIQEDLPERVHGWALYFIKVWLTPSLRTELLRHRAAEDAADKAAQVAEQKAWRPLPPRVKTPA